MATDLVLRGPAAGHRARSANAVRPVPLWRDLLRYRWLYLLLLPGLAYFVVFKYLPMYGLTIAFKDYVPFLGYSGSEWVGLKHFEELFTGPDFGRLMFNTLLLALLTIVFVFPAPIVVALMLNELRRQRAEAVGAVADLHPALPVLDDRRVADVPAVLGRLRRDRELDPRPDRRAEDRLRRAGRTGSGR